ncbi:hypothetical protein BD770DRAFT_445430 [Pilaira anomala]|nr:hypothetical protein BD770DRAFT_445430 [Pilaira anomala]
MPKILDFPAEIIDQIIQDLSRKDLAHCLRVNKSFYRYTIDEFYSSLKMGYSNLDRFLIYMKNNELEYDPNLPSKRNLIKFMEIDFVLIGLHASHTGFNWDKLFSISSGLTCIDISKSKYDKSILRYMLKYVDTRSLLHLQQIITDNSVHRYDSREGDFYNLYYSVCCKFKLSLTHFRLWDFYVKYRLTKKEQEMVYLDRTSAFKKLTNLVVYYSSSIPVESMISSVIFSVCPGLTHFSLACGSDFRSVYDGLNNSWEPSSSKYSVNPYNPNQSNLKVVHLQIKNMTTACIESIYSNIPTDQLDEFILELELEEETNEWFESTQISDIERFLQYLKKAAKQFKLYAMHISNGRVSESGRNSLAKLWKASSSYSEVKPRKEMHMDTLSRSAMSIFHLDTLLYLKLENNTSQIFETINACLFFRGSFISFPNLLENVDRMEISLSSDNMCSKLNYLIKNYSHVKRLGVVANEFVLWEMPLETSDVYDFKFKAAYPFQRLRLSFSSSILKHRPVQYTTSLPHLEQLQICPDIFSSPAPIAKQTQLYYFNVCYKFRQNLTHLVIDNPYSAYCMESYDNNKTELDTLPHFKRLTNLIFDCELDDVSQFQSLLNPTVLLATCQNLTHFSLIDRPSFYNCPPMKHNLEELELVPRNIYAEESPSTTPRHSNISKLKSVLLSSMAMNKTHMDIILDSVSTSQLDELNLEFTVNTHNKEWLDDDTNLDYFRNFLQHIQAAKRFKLLISAYELPFSLNLKPINKLWRVLDTYGDMKPRKIIDIFLFMGADYMPPSEIILTFKNEICKLNLRIHEGLFFDSKRFHLKFIYNDEAVAPENEKTEMQFTTSESCIHSKLNHLINFYQDFKKLQVKVKLIPHLDATIEGIFTMSKKTLASVPTSDLQEEEEYEEYEDINPMDNSSRHCSFTEVSIGSYLLFRLSSTYDEYIHFPFKINLFKLKNIPVLRDDDRHFRFHFKFSLPELVLSFTSKNSLDVCPIHLTVLNHDRSIVLDVLITTSLHNTPVAINNPSSTLLNIASNYTISSVNFEKVKIYYQNKRIPIKSINRPKVSFNLRSFSRRKFMS